MVGGSADKEAAFFQMYVVAFLIVALVVFQLWNHYRWRAKNDSRAGERAVHMTHSGWALYTLYGANLVNTMMKGSYYDCGCLRGAMRIATIIHHDDQRRQPPNDRSHQHIDLGPDVTQSV
jgi:hypothetical protein